MAYRVIAGYVTVTTEIGPGRALVDIPRGTDVPGDVPVEEVERLLALGHIEPVADPGAPAEDPAEPAPRPRKRATKAG